MNNDMDADDVFRSLPGMVSGRQAAKFNLTARKTRNIPTKMADFDDRGGVRDQGGVRDRGASEAGRRHIDKKQSMGSPAKASGKPSKGASAGAQKQPTKNAHINDASLTSPAFPAGGSKMKGAKAKTPARAKGKIPAQGGQYGGGGRNTQ